MISHEICYKYYPPELIPDDCIDRMFMNGVMYKITEEWRTAEDGTLYIARSAHMAIAPTKNHTTIIDFIKRDEGIVLASDRGFVLPRSMSRETRFALSISVTEGHIYASPGNEDYRRFTNETGSSIETLRIGAKALVSHIYQLRKAGGRYVTSEEVIEGTYAVD